jgi:lycopene cyclase domain-containing protein
MTYTAINIVFLAAAIAVALFGWTRRRIARLALLITAVAMIALTIGFDNLMIQVGLFTYADPHISGIRIGVMPVEDLSYTVFALLVLPALWELTSRREPRTLRRRAPRERAPREQNGDGRA